MNNLGKRGHFGNMLIQLAHLNAKQMIYTVAKF